MSRFAKVVSTDAVQRVGAALDSFKEEATAALDNLELEVRRALDWILHNRKEFWDQEVRRGWDRVAEAREELERRRTYQRIGEHEPACRDEKMALEKAKRRLHAAEQKVELVRRWGHTVQHELTEYQGAVNQLATWLESDHPRAQADLKRMLAALESYVALGVPTEAPAGTAGSAVAGTLRVPPAHNGTRSVPATPGGAAAEKADQPEPVKEASREVPSDQAETPIPTEPRP